MQLVAILAGAFLLLLVAFLVVGPERIWRLAGPPDLGDVEFQELQRRSTPNDALACPPDLCRAQGDLASPIFLMRARDLRAAFHAALESEPRLERVAQDDATLSERYIQRSRVMRFPDSVVVRFYDLPDGRATLAVYSRSQIGRGDWGVNRARIERWLEKLRGAAQGAGGNSG